MADKVVKVPMIMQMEALECGAACLDMILAYHGKWLPLEKVRADCGVSRDGSNAKNMMVAARSYGFIAKGYKYGLEDIKNVKLPVIIHWNFNHFVVLTGFRKNKAVINDPARGKVEVSMEEFDQSFTGICLCFEPSEKFEKGGKKKSVIEFAKKRLAGTLGLIIFNLLVYTILCVLKLIYPVLNQRIFIDRVLSKESPDWLYPVLGGLILIAILQIIINVVSVLYKLKMEGKLAMVANTTFMWHVLRLPMNFFSQRNAGDIAYRQSSNQDIAKTLIGELYPVVLDFIMLVFYLILMIRISWILTLIGISSLVLDIFMVRTIADKEVNISRAQMRDQGNLASATVSGISMIETIKSAGAENGYFRRWSGFQAAVNTGSVRTARLYQFLGNVPEFVRELINIAIIIIGCMFIMQDGSLFSLGILSLFQVYMSNFMTPVESFLELGKKIQTMRTNMERVEDVMNYEPDVKTEDNSDIIDKDYKKLSGSIEIKNVTFGYATLGEPVIHDFSMSIKPGSKVAFVGPSGCGKSTLSKLISGLYEPWSGEILFDGKKKSEIDRGVFTSSLAVVDQDIIIFEDSISENIKMWDKSIEDYEVIMAARDAQIHKDIMERDGGYNYKIIEKGKNFSGGQKQRLEIARVLAQDPTIIILDEATASLDAKTEYEVVKAIENRGITCIIIAHRLSTIRNCDEIVVLDEGRVIERGTHDELYNNGGVYTKLITTE